MGPAHVVPEVAEAEKVRTWKQMAVVLQVSPTKVYRLWKAGELVVYLEGAERPTPIVYEDHIGRFWAPRAYLLAWMRSRARVAQAS